MQCLREEHGEGRQLLLGIRQCDPQFQQGGQRHRFLLGPSQTQGIRCEIATGLYRAMLEAEQRAGSRDAIAASTKILTDLLAEKGMSYDELVLAI